MVSRTFCSRTLTLTRHRMAEQPVVILPQDTTEMDFTRPQQQVVGAGPVDGSKRRGAFLHPLHAFTPDGIPWARSPRTFGADRTSRPCRLRNARRDAKSFPSNRRKAGAGSTCCGEARSWPAEVPGTRFICVADSEADIYELLAEAETPPRRVDWIVRAAGDRALQDDAENAASAGLLHAEVMRSPVLFTKTITVRARSRRSLAPSRALPAASGRQAEVEVRAARVTLHAPYRRDRKLPPLTVNVVLVREIAPPPARIRSNGCC